MAPQATVDRLKSISSSVTLVTTRHGNLHMQARAATCMHSPRDMHRCLVHRLSVLCWPWSCSTSA